MLCPFVFRLATNSYENAVNTIDEFCKLREKNPKLKRLIVISDWQYLLRQILSTKKIASDKGLDDIEIIGYPASMLEKQNNQEVALDAPQEDIIEVLLGELNKIRKYENDVEDMQLPIDGYNEGRGVLVNIQKEDSQKHNNAKKEPENR